MTASESIDAFFALGWAVVAHAETHMSTVHGDGHQTAVSVDWTRPANVPLLHADGRKQGGR